MLTEPDKVQRVGILGAGVIGGGWALHFLRNGMEVMIFDPSSESRKQFDAMKTTVWPTLEELGLAPGASPDRCRFADSLEEMASSVDVIQENAPENLEVKQSIYARLDAAAPPDVPILSSTSGFAMTDIQKKCRHPERTVVGHPFNPPYLIPFIEVVGGEATDPAVVDWAVAFYRSTGKRPVRMSREVPGFIANRLQEALWREALHMVANDEATVAEIDAAIADGPGLRWAVMGPCLTFHLAGGEGGMAHMLDHFGPSLQSPWTRLEAPVLDQCLRDRMVQGCEGLAGGMSQAELARERDRCIIEFMKARERCRAGICGEGER